MKAQLNRKKNKKMDKRDLISVIVPVYNSEQYIYECIKSVLSQSYTEFELILIDDGSEDNSRDICDRICKVNKRIKFICQKHQGVSAARNKGIKEAEGKYLLFLDSDDVIHPQLLEELYKLQEEYHTIIATESAYYLSAETFQSPEGWENEKYGIEKKYLSNEKAIESLLSGDLQASLYSIGGKMIRYDAVKTTMFDENLTHGEDTLFLYQILEKGANVIVLCRNWYYYRIHKEASSNHFSIESCKCRYKVEQYICNREMEAGRMFNAVQKEEGNILLLMQWYEIAYGIPDSDLKRYIKKLSKNEKKSYMFSQISWISKARFCFIFRCYPLYWIIHKLVFRFPQYSRLKWNIKYKNMLSKKNI